MLSGFLGGLSNLGQIYGGYQAQNAINLQTQLRQLQLQNAQIQQQLGPDLLKLAAAGGLQPKPLQPQQPQQSQPISQPAAPTAPTAPTTLTPPSYPQPQPSGGTPASPLLSASAGPLDLPGIPGGGPLGVPGLPGMSGFGGGAIGAPATEQAGGYGTGIAPQPASIEGTGGKSRGLGDLLPLNTGMMGTSPFGPGQPYTGPALSGTGVPQQTAELGPPLGLADIYTGVSTLGRAAPPSAPAGGIVQPRGGFGVPDQYAAEARTAGPARGRLTPPQTAAADDTGALGSPQGGGLFGTILQLESGNNDNIRGPGSYGEIGPAQITPDTWKQYSRPGENIADAQTNRAVGMRVTQDLWNKSGGDAAAVLVGYNRGEGAMRRFQAGGDNLDVLRGTSMMPTAAYQRAVIQAGGKGSVSAADGTVADMGRNLSPEQHSIGQRGLMMMARMPQIPQAIQMADPQQLAQMIEQTFPGTSDAVKGAIFLKALPYMNEQAKEQTAQAWKVFDAQMKEVEFGEKVSHDIAGEARERAADWDVVESDQGLVRVNKVTGQVQPVSGLSGAHKLGTPRQAGYSQPFQQDGKTFRINPQGQVEEIKLPGEGAVTKLGAGSPLQQQEIQLYQDLQKAKESGTEDDVKKAQQRIDDFNRAQGKGISGPKSAIGQLTQLALQQHPEWRTEEGGAEKMQEWMLENRRLNAIESGFGSGVLGRNVVSLNTVADHALTVRKAFEDLETGNVQRFNQVAQTIARETGKPEPTNFETAFGIMSGEVVRLFTSTGGSVGDREHYRSLLEARFSQRQGKGSLDIMDEMINARFNSLRQQYSQGDPKRAEKFDKQFLTDESRTLHANVARQQKAAEKTKELTGYKPGDIIERGGKRYRVTGGDPNDPDVEEIK